MMKRGWTSLALAFLLWAVCGCAGTYVAVADEDSPPPPPRSVDVSYFYDALAPYGNWIWDDAYGWIWYPLDVPVDWSPYTDGQWIWTEDGWTWVSDWDWGWATFHYGRWFDYPDYGWCWVPGTEWAPAWVAWREGDGWIGWAPLPPEIGWRDEAGFDWNDWDNLPGMRHHWWSFCRESDFAGPDIQSRLAPRPKAVVLVRRTRDITNYGFVGTHVINRSIDVGRIRAASGRDIRTYRVADAPRPFEGPARKIQRDTYYTYRPRLAPAPEGSKPRMVPERRTAPAGKPMPPATPAPGIDRSGRDQVRREQMDMQRRQTAERKRLQQDQERELRQPPTGVSQEQLRQQHAEEQRALEEQATRDQRVLQARRDQGQQRQQMQQQGQRRQEQPPRDREDRKAPVRKKAPVKERRADDKERQDQR